MEFEVGPCATAYEGRGLRTGTEQTGTATDILRRFLTLGAPKVIWPRAEAAEALLHRAAGEIHKGRRDKARLTMASALSYLDEADPTAKGDMYELIPVAGTVLAMLVG